MFRINNKCKRNSGSCRTNGILIVNEIVRMCTNLQSTVDFRLLFHTVAPIFKKNKRAIYGLHFQVPLITTLIFPISAKLMGISMSTESFTLRPRILWTLTFYYVAESTVDTIKICVLAEFYWQNCLYQWQNCLFHIRTSNFRKLFDFCDRSVKRLTDVSFFFADVRSVLFSQNLYQKCPFPYFLRFHVF